MTSEQETELATKHQTIPNAFETGNWHALLTQVKGDTLSVSIDGKVVGTLKSEGVAHPQKNRIRLSFPRNAVIDDVKIQSLTD